MNTNSSQQHGFPEPPKPGLPAHSRVLRHALLNKHGESVSRSRAGFFSSPMTRFAAVGVLSLALVLACSSFIPQSPFSTPVASAHELLNRAATKVVSMPDVMRIEIEKRMNADLDSTLEEAKAAPDLRILTPDEFKAEQKKLQDQAFKTNAPVAGALTLSAKPMAIYHMTTPDGMETATAGEMGTFDVHAENIEISSGTIINIKGNGATVVSSTPGMKFSIAPVQLKEPSKYLAYTNPEGQKVILGLDEDDVVVMKMISLTMKMGDGSDANVMMGTMRGFKTEDIKK